MRCRSGPNFTGRREDRKIIGSQRRRVGQCAAVKKASAKAEQTPGISAIGVEGYKSLRTRTEIAIRPLTLLAGANSSGKSSIMQGPLLLKQTLEAPYDPGALLLDGSHVRFTSAEQLLSRSGKKVLTNTLGI